MAPGIRGMMVILRQTSGRFSNMKQGESTADRFLFGALEKVEKESKSTSFEKKTKIGCCGKMMIYAVCFAKNGNRGSPLRTPLVGRWHLGLLWKVDQRLSFLPEDPVEKSNVGHQRVPRGREITGQRLLRTPGKIWSLTQRCGQNCVCVWIMIWHGQ